MCVVSHSGTFQLIMTPTNHSDQNQSYHESVEDKIGVGREMSAGHEELAGSDVVRVASEVRDHCIFVRLQVM